jgi:hypothetical protein
MGNMTSRQGKCRLTYMENNDSSIFEGNVIPPSAFLTKKMVFAPGEVVTYPRGEDNSPTFEGNLLSPWISTKKMASRIPESIDSPLGRRFASSTRGGPITDLGE